MNTEELIQQAGENGYNSALNDFWDEVKKIDENKEEFNRTNLFEIWKKLKGKTYIALK